MYNTRGIFKGWSGVPKGGNISRIQFEEIQVMTKFSLDETEFRFVEDCSFFVHVDVEAMFVVVAIDSEFRDHFRSSQNDIRTSL